MWLKRASLIAILAIAPVAQGSGQIAPATRRRILPELRTDVVAGTTSIAHLGGGVHINTGAYVRMAILAGGGYAWRDSVRDASYRLEVQARFLLDPLRTSRFGLYGIGGINAAHDPLAEWQTRLLMGVGVELPAHGRAALAIEAALAGGFRISVATRRLPLGRR